MSKDSIPEKGNCGTTSPGRCTTLQKWRWESGRTFMWGLPPPHPFTDWHTPAVLSSELLRSALMMRHTALREPLSGECRSSRPQSCKLTCRIAPGSGTVRGFGREVGECSPGLYTASFFLLTGMIPGLGCLQILMVVYIICRYRFSFSSSFLYFLLWLCRRLMADVGFCSRNLSVILSWLLYLDGLSFPSFSIGWSRYHSF